MKLIHHSPGKSKKTINLPDECVAYLVQSDAPLVDDLDGRSYLISSYFGYGIGKAYRYLVFGGSSRKESYYILCSFNRKLIDEAISIFKKEIDAKIKIVQEYKKDKVFDDDDRIISFLAQERIEEWKRKKAEEERIRRIIRKKEKILKLLLNGSKEDLKRIFKLLGSTFDGIIDEIDEKELKKL